MFQIGEYDSDEGELWDDNDDDSASSSDEGNQSGGSWETESEHSIKVNNINSNASDNLDDSCMRSRLAASIERARIAMTKLENIFNDKSGKKIYALVMLPSLLLGEPSRALAFSKMSLNRAFKYSSKKCSCF